MITLNQTYINSLTHLDKNEDLLSKEHYGYYLVTEKELDTKTRRVYFSINHKIEYYKSIEDKNKNRKKYDTYNLLNIENDLNYEIFVLGLVSKIFHNKIMSRPNVRNILRGLKIIIDYLLENKIDLYEIYKLNHQTQINILKENEKESIGRLVLKAYYEINSISNEFIKYENLGIFLDGNEVRRRKSLVEKNDLLEISPIVLFQLKDFVIKELDSRFNSYYNYINLIDNRYDLINSKNILKTLVFTSIHKNTLWWHTLINLLDEKDTEIYNTYKNDFNKENLLKKGKEKELEEYLRDSKILEKNIEMFFCVMYESGADLITDNLKSKFCFGEINNASSFRRSFYLLLGIKREFYIEQTLFDYNFLYLIYLLTLIETGNNAETLNSWEIKNIDGKIILGIDKELVIEIEGYKNRSNSGTVSTLLSKKSKLYKYILMILDINKELYAKSEFKNFFQYYSTSRNKKMDIQKSDRRFLGYVRENNNNFYNKYEIFDGLGKRVFWIDHTKLRKSQNYQMALQGKSSFERQLIKNHKSSDTTELHYSTSDYKIDIKNKLGKTLEEIFEKIFKGTFNRNIKQGNNIGLLSDCSDNKTPTYIGHNLKEGYICLDWKKCLTMCDKCVVIPEIHGAAIYAWREYLLEIQNDYQEYFDKEGFNYDLQATEETLSLFTNEELKYSEDNKYKYENLVRMKLTTTVKEEKAN